MDTSPTIGFFLYIRPSQVDTPVLHCTLNGKLIIESYSEILMGYLTFCSWAASAVHCLRREMEDLCFVGSLCGPCGSSFCSIVFKCKWR